MFLRCKIDIKKRELEEVKLWGGIKIGKIHCSTSVYCLNLFPDVFKDSGSLINEGVFHSLSPYLINCY